MAYIPRDAQGFIPLPRYAFTSRNPRHSSLRHDHPSRGHRCRHLALDVGGAWAKRSARGPACSLQADDPFSPRRYHSYTSCRVLGCHGKGAPPCATLAMQHALLVARRQKGRGPPCLLRGPSCDQRLPDDQHQTPNPESQLMMSRNPASSAPAAMATISTHQFHTVQPIGLTGDSIPLPAIHQ
ncbi:unnamed protein product [Diplocarpon coronariae]